MDHDLLQQLEVFLQNPISTESGKKSQKTISADVKTYLDSKAALSALDKAHTTIRSRIESKAKMKPVFSAVPKMVKKIMVSCPMSTTVIDYYEIVCVFLAEIVRADAVHSSIGSLDALATFSELNSLFPSEGNNNKILNVWNEFVAPCFTSQIISLLQSDTVQQGDGGEGGVDILGKLASWGSIPGVDVVVESAVQRHLPPKIVEELSWWDASADYCVPLSFLCFQWLELYNDPNSPIGRAFEEAKIRHKVFGIIKDALRKSDVLDDIVMKNLSLNEGSSCFPHDLWVRNVISHGVVPRLRDGGLVVEALFRNATKHYVALLWLVPQEVQKEILLDVVVPVLVALVRFSDGIGKTELSRCTDFVEDLTKALRMDGDEDVEVETGFWLVLSEIRNKLKGESSNPQVGTVVHWGSDDALKACGKYARKSAAEREKSAQAAAIDLRQRGRLIDDIQAFAAQEGVPFNPVPSSAATTSGGAVGKQLYRMGRRVIYVEKDVIYEQSESGRWQPISLEQLFSK
eukprot:PhF_6_TR33013/c0_g1_i1/m.48648